MAFTEAGIFVSTIEGSVLRLRSGE
jgi:hypothetical protein